MNKDISHIARLIMRQMEGTMTEAESEELLEWVSASQDNRQLADELLDDENLRKGFSQFYARRERVWDRLESYVGTSNPKVVSIRSWKKMVVAASILVAVGIGSYFVFFNRPAAEPPIVKLYDVAAPGKTRAMITLADGRRIAVEELSSLVEQGVEIRRTEDGKITYTASPSVTPGPSEGRRSLI
jgi:transmembrane sensor